MAWKTNEKSGSKENGFDEDDFQRYMFVLIIR